MHINMHAAQLQKINRTEYQTDDDWVSKRHGLMLVVIETLLVDRKQNVTMSPVNLPFISGSQTAIFMQSARSNQNLQPVTL